MRDNKINLNKSNKKFKSLASKVVITDDDFFASKQDKKEDYLVKRFMELEKYEWYKDLQKKWKRIIKNIRRDK